MLCYKYVPVSEEAAAFPGLFSTLIWGESHHLSNFIQTTSRFNTLQYYVRRQSGGLARIPDDPSLASWPACPIIHVESPDVVFQPAKPEQGRTFRIQAKSMCLNN